MDRLFYTPWYILFVVFIVQPLNGWLIAKGNGRSVLLGVSLILLQAPFFVNLVFNKMNLEIKGE